METLWIYSMEILWIQYENIAYNMDYGNIVCICMHIDCIHNTPNNKIIINIVNTKILNNNKIQ